MLTPPSAPTQSGMTRCAPATAAYAAGSGSSGDSSDSNAAPAACTNCLCPVDRHTEKTGDGMGCSTAIAVSWADGPVGCECERCIPQGTPCCVDGCSEDAVHYRMNRDRTRAFDMCVEHYEEAEPYCERYYELTGGRDAAPDSASAPPACDKR